MENNIVVSGIRPTGILHLGNYFGAVHHFLELQNQFDCYFFVADWHSLTTHPDTATLQQQVNLVLAQYLACGLNPDNCTLFVQSDVPEIAELYLYLNMLAYKGELEKTVTFKDKSRLQPQNINAGLLTYPVLQAADILIHRASKVPVGKDQEQHLEMARNFAQRFNHRYGLTFPEPQACSFSSSSELAKVYSLTGEGKMSKSENEFGTIYLTDTNEMILKKLLKAKTDAGPTEQNSIMPHYIENLFNILQWVAPKDVYEQFLFDYNHSSAQHQQIRYGHLKTELAKYLANFIEPIREKTNALQQNKKLLNEYRQQAAQKARASASDTLSIVRQQMNF